MKKKIFAIFLSVAMVMCMMPGMAFAAGDAPVPPWDGDGSVIVNGDGTYVLFGDNSENHYGPNAKVALEDGADMRYGFEMSATLNFDDMGANESALWEFGVTGPEETCMEAATFGFHREDAETPAKLSGFGNGHGKTEAIVPEIDAVGNEFNLKAVFTPNESGKIVITYYANDVKIGDMISDYDYADVKGPRFGWLAYCNAENGITATVPTAKVLPNPNAPVPPWDGDGSVIVNGDGTYVLFGDNSENHYGPNAKVALEDGADMRYGFEMSATLNFDDMGANESALWEFGVTGPEETCMEAATFGFHREDAETPAKLSGFGNGHGKTEAIVPDIDAVGNEFNLKAVFTPNESGKIVITYYANDVKIGDMISDYDYADVKGPRFGWLAYCNAENGITATVPTAKVIPAPSNGNGGNSGGGGYIPPVDKAVDAVEDLIKAIGDVTLDDAAAIDAARDAYDKLTADQQKKVDNYKVLTDAEAAYKVLVDEAEAAAKAEEIAKIEGTKLAARSKNVVLANGKHAIRIQWYEVKDGVFTKLDKDAFDKVVVYRATKKAGEYKKVFTSRTDKYYNTAIKKGTRYFYKVRGVKEVAGEDIYTGYSLYANRVAK